MIESHTITHQLYAVVATFGILGSLMSREPLRLETLNWAETFGMSANEKMQN